MKDQIEERSSQLLRNLSSCEKKAWKQIRLERDSNPYLCDACAVLYQLSYQVSWDQERMKVREVILHIGPIPIVIPLKLFLGLPRDPVSQES